MRGSKRWIKLNSKELIVLELSNQGFGMGEARSTHGDKADTSR
jgi:hypothetical protein